MSDAQTAVELRQLIAMLERSGLAEQRADARAVLESSRALLRAQQGGRAPPSGRKLLGKLARLGLLLCDAAVVAGFCAGVAGGLSGAMAPMAALALLLGGAAWLALRAARARAWAWDWANEGLYGARYHAAWGRDWFAEAFSTTAMRRLELLLAAREVMWTWQQHRDTVPNRPRLADVGECLSLAYGQSAGAAWAEAIAARSDADWERRLAALRWSALIVAFEDVAASGALKVQALPPAEFTGTWPPPSAAEIHQIVAETPERIQRRKDLRELIRRKRDDITTAYTWKLKTPAENAQRDLHINELRADISALERELGGIEI